MGALVYFSRYGNFDPAARHGPTAGALVFGAMACGNSSTASSSGDGTAQSVVKTSATNALVGKTFTSTSVDGAAIPGGGPLMLTFPSLAGSA